MHLLEPFPTLPTMILLLWIFLSYYAYYFPTPNLEDFIIFYHIYKNKNGKCPLTIMGGL